MQVYKERPWLNKCWSYLYISQDTQRHSGICAHRHTELHSPLSGMHFSKPCVSRKEMKPPNAPHVCHTFRNFLNKSLFSCWNICSEADPQCWQSLADFPEQNNVCQVDRGAQQPPPFPQTHTHTTYPHRLVYTNVWPLKRQGSGPDLHNDREWRH